MPSPNYTVENATPSFIHSTPGAKLRESREAIRETISRSTEPWFPGLADLLTRDNWLKLARDGFDMANYGTHRWLKKDPAAGCVELAALDLEGALKCGIEALPDSSRMRYQRLGLVLTESFPVETFTSVVRSALSYVGLIPGLYRTVAQYLRTLHVLDSPSGDIDTSYSDPDLPFSIFVSIPCAEQHREIRLAESIVHECMHLQLTMLDSFNALVRDGKAVAFSPWRQEERSLGGVLHGWYVFAVIHAFFRALDRTSPLGPDERAFIVKRCDQISLEVSEVAHLASAEELTDDGRLLTRHLLGCF